MNEYVIFTDSSADLPWEVYTQRKIEYISLSVHIKNDAFLDTPNFDLTNFYKQMKAGAITGTSQINVGTFISAFRATLEQGKDIFYTGLSSGLSGTYQSACIARDALLTEYPKCKISIVDSHAVTLGLGLMLLDVCDKRDQGNNLEQITQWLELNKMQYNSYFTVDDLVYLQRGGRISKTAAVVGSLLGVKPVMYVNREGKLIPLSKVRGRSASLEAIAAEMISYADTKDLQRVSISHSDCINDVNHMKELINQSFNVKEYVVRDLGGTVGAHAGPGTIAVFFKGITRKE